MLSDLRVWLARLLLRRTDYHVAETVMWIGGSSLECGAEYWPAGIDPAQIRDVKMLGNDERPGTPDDYVPTGRSNPFVIGADYQR